MPSASFRWFLGVACLGPLGIAALASCGSGESTLLIGVSNMPARGVKLVVKATLDGKEAMSTQELPASTGQFGVALAAGVSGHLILTLQSLDTDGCTQGTG